MHSGPVTAHPDACMLFDSRWTSCIAHFGCQPSCLLTVLGGAAASLQTAGSMLAQRHAAYDKELERIARVDGWLIPPSDIAICVKEDGSDWLLGVGGFGQVALGFRV